jgi:hypothetical protein
MSETITDRRVDNAIALLTQIDAGDADYFVQTDCAWVVRSIANSVQAGTTAMPNDARLVRALKGFIS